MGWPNSRTRSAEANSALLAHPCHELQLGGGRSAVFGIVDILQHYGATKRAETAVLGHMLRRRGISCQPPRYANRFLRFIRNRVLDLGEEVPRHRCE